jgi:hypothetical protein
MNGDQTPFIFLLNKKIVYILYNEKKPYNKRRHMLQRLDEVEDHVLKQSNNLFVHLRDCSRHIRRDWYKEECKTKGIPDDAEKVAIYFVYKDNSNIEHAHFYEENEVEDIVLSLRSLTFSKNPKAILEFKLYEKHNRDLYPPIFKKTFQHHHGWAEDFRILGELKNIIRQIKRKDPFYQGIRRC